MTVRIPAGERAPRVALPAMKTKQPCSLTPSPRPIYHHDMKKMLLIAHAFHQKTKSNGFLIDLFSPTYDISFCHLEPDEIDVRAMLAPFIGTRFDLVVCWQMILPAGLLKALACPRNVIFPMYDHSGSWGIERWFPLRHTRIISFSTHLTERLRGWGFDVQGVQFFPEPMASPQWGDPTRAFFWSRIEKINIGTITELLRASCVKSIHVHRSMDPGQAFLPPSSAIKERFTVTESEWFNSREELAKLIEACGIYLAPRLREGIGMSFLEAMAMGRCVIAPDLPTMNEYIQQGETGILDDPSRITPLALPDIRPIQERALACAKAGRLRWERDQANLIAWCEATPRKAGWRPWLHLVLRACLHPGAVSQPWRRKMISVRLRKGAWEDTDIRLDLHRAPPRAALMRTRCLFFVAVPAHCMTACDPADPTLPVQR